MSRKIDLTFPSIVYGKRDTQHDLYPLLYLGGAAERADKARPAIELGKLGSIVEGRIALVKKIHEEMSANLAGGGSVFTIINHIRYLRQFFSWTDQNQEDLTIETVADVFAKWADHLLYRQRIKSEMTPQTALKAAGTVAQILGRSLELPSDLMAHTRLRIVNRRQIRGSTKGDKQNLQTTFEFGRFLLDITNSLSIQTIQGTLPITISLRDGRKYEEWFSFTPPSVLGPPKDNSDKNRRERLRKQWEDDTSIENRRTAINMRLEAELLIFISQTGMNLIQACTLKNAQFHYLSFTGGYQVRHYKSRRNGEVEFEIYSAYKDIFKKYCSWRNEIFPEDPEGLLFPLIRSTGDAEGKLPGFGRIRSLSKEFEIRYVSPRSLRRTRVNWLLRKLGDPETTADMAQHSKQTLLGVYREPNLQLALAEISRFHNSSDPVLTPPGPGHCLSPAPSAIQDIPENAPKPDCISPAGCLFCRYQRDIDTADHVWSLATFRYLKTAELAKYRAPSGTGNEISEHPAHAAIRRLTLKLEFLAESSERRRRWVDEALTRLQEGDYHPAWGGFIELWEA
jgi:hypothetical protein